MDNESFLNLLSSGLVSSAIDAIGPDYAPSSEEEIAALCEMARWSNSRIQNKLFEVTQRTAPELAFPLLSVLATSSLKEETRNQAIEVILNYDHPQKGEAVLQCINDQTPSIQKKALRGLQGWQDKKSISTLIDRFLQPTAALLPENVGEEENIRRASIEGLKTKGASEAIDPLVSYWLKHHPHHREQFIGTLTVIAGKNVIQSLLNAAEGNGAVQGVLPDDSLRLDFAEIIGRIENKQLSAPTRQRYQNLLQAVYPYAARNRSGGWKTIIQESPKYLNETLLAAIISEFKKIRTQPAAADIVESFRVTNILASEE